jgi:sarcosine oxidase
MQAEVIVVGAGVMGAATAWALAREGRDVLVLEQFALDHTRGSSHGQTRIFRLAYPEADWVRLAQEALPGWRSLESESGERLLELSGFLELIRDPALGSRDALIECGVEFELLEDDEVERRFGFSVPDGLMALHQPEAGVVYADRARRAFLGCAQARGARVSENTPVRSLDEVDADVVVVTAGAWAKPLLVQEGIELDVVPTRETVVYLRLARDRPPPSVVAELSDGHGFYALTDPVHGLKVGHHKSGPVADPNVAGEPDAEIVRRCAEWAAARYDLTSSEPAAVQTCLYTNTPDESFVLERHGRIVVGSACSGLGFMFAPAIGARLAALAQGGP